MRLVIALVTTGAAFALNAALAFPDGAPWGAANPSADQHCATCHFGADPVVDSDALLINGLPQKPLPGEDYELRVLFEDPQIVSAGFQLIAHTEGGTAGTFSSSELAVEFVGAAVRSTAPVKSDGNASWVIEWHAPDQIAAPVIFFVAASAANDDGSPFGDTVHYRSYELVAD